VFSTEPHLISTLPSPDYNLPKKFEIILEKHTICLKTNPLLENKPTARIQTRFLKPNPLFKNKPSAQK
jgi:hypothetical protein